MPESIPELTVRDKLAIARTKLANQRTLLAFFAAFIQFIALGITFAKVEAFAEVSWVSIPFFVLAPICLTLGVVSFLRNKRVMGKAYSGE